MKKICFMILNISFIGRIERVNCVIINMLSENPNCDITLLSLFEDKMNSQCYLTISDKFKVKWLIKEPLDIRKDASKIIKKIETEIKLNQYDIVVSSDLRNSFTYIKMNNRSVLKLVLWEHFNNYSTQSFAHKIVKEIQRMVTDKMIVLTEKDKKSYISDYGYPTKVKKIYNAYSFAQKADPDIRAKKILITARLSEIKRLDDIIEIYKIVFYRFPDWNCDIYGEGYQFNFLNELIKTNEMGNNIFLKGLWNDAKGIYTKYSILCLT